MSEHARRSVSGFAFLIATRCSLIRMFFRDQGDREQALLDIKRGRVKILVATDLASRGLDIEDIT